MLEEGDLPYVVNSLGEGRVWVTNIGGNIENGDYISISFSYVNIKNGNISVHQFSITIPGS